jgi:hypothetical protein
VAAAVEPISPELVLVDPELARVARARLDSRTDIATIPRVVEAATVTPPEERRIDGVVKRVQERLTFVLLGVSVAANGALAAAVLAGDGGRPVAIPAVAAQEADKPPQQIPTHEVAATTVAHLRTHPPVRERTPASVGIQASIPTKRAVERQILALVFRSPKTTLPPQLIDARTGLPKNNLQAVCRHERGRVFRCVVRAALNHRARVVVRYRVLLTGRGVYSWSRPDALTRHRR